MQQNKKFLRSERIADVIHKELASIIVKFCHDPRLDKLTITNVTLSPDLSIAKIYFTNFDSESENIKQILKILKHASNFLRVQLASKMSLRKVPELKFFYDENTAYGIKMENLFAKINLPDYKSHL